jgi:AcrR family transcriptional regulator
MSEHTTQEALSRKEREKRARQQDILNAARELFAAKGFQNTTLDEIAQKAEFGKGTLYNYFASKEDIFHAIIDQAIENSITMAQECVASSGDLRSKLTTYARANIQFICENGELLHAIFQELHGGRKTDPARVQDIIHRAHMVTTIISATIKTEMDAGTIRPGNPVEFISLLDDMVRGHSSKQITLHGPLGPAEIDRAANLIVSVFLDGITVRHSKG